MMNEDIGGMGEMVSWEEPEEYMGVALDSDKVMLESGVGRGSSRRG